MKFSFVPEPLIALPSSSVLRTSSTALSFEDLVLYISIPVYIVTLDAHVVDYDAPACQSFTPNDGLSLASSAPRLGLNKFGQKVLKVTITWVLAVRMDRMQAMGEV